MARKVEAQQLRLEVAQIQRLEKPRRRHNGNPTPASLGPRLALSPDEAARILGVSRDYFDEHILPELRIIRRGRRILVPLSELDRWLERAAARAPR